MDTVAPGAGAFTTTHWSVVLLAGAGDSARAQEALSQLCRTYWYPLYAFVRRRGHDPDEAQDLTQEFFFRLLSREDLARVHPSRGRFRSFLLASLQHFLVNEWKREHRLKRGGGAARVPLDAASAETRYAAEPASDWTPERLYERRWAMTLLERTFAVLREEHRAAGKLEIFERLKGLLTGEDTAPYAEVARVLGSSETAVKMAVHRLRRRFREVLRAEIAQTVAHPNEVDDELRHLFAALG